MDGFETLKLDAAGALRALSDQGRLRTLRISPRQPELINLSHNDYLNLSSDLRWRALFGTISSELPPGAGGSRLLDGEHGLFRELELAFAAFKEAEDALYFSSGFAANEACAQTLARCQVAIFSDQLNHASIIDGIRLTGLSAQERHIFAHNSIEQLEAQLSCSKAPINIIYCESLYSMDGDMAPLKAFDDLAARYRGVLVIDEAHAIGVYGSQGMGLIQAQGLSHDHVISINTCGKALGVGGALVACPSWFRELLINYGRPFIFSTAPSPWLAQALLLSLNYIKQLDAARLHLRELGAVIRGELKSLGLNLGLSTSHIIPIIIGDDQKALALEQRLFTKGILARAIRPPTVPEAMARLRLSLHAGLSERDLDRIIAAITEAL